jgi:hypothetical protein
VGGGLGDKWIPGWRGVSGVAGLGVCWVCAASLETPTWLRVVAPATAPASRALLLLPLLLLLKVVHRSKLLPLPGEGVLR